MPSPRGGGRTPRGRGRGARGAARPGGGPGRPAAAGGSLAGLAPPEPMGTQTAAEDALRSASAGIASGCRNGYEVRLYGFAKLTGSYISAPQPDGRAAPAEHPADRKRRRRASGDFFMTGRFSRFGTTRGPDGLGHAGNAPRRRFGGARRPPPPRSSGCARPGRARRRQLPRLIGQANSLWNEGVFETLIDATNLNQSFVRQAQLRVTGRLAEGLTGSCRSRPRRRPIPPPAACSPPAPACRARQPRLQLGAGLLGRLTWRRNGADWARGLLRQIEIRTDGTAAAPPAISDTAPAWGVAAHLRLPMRLLSEPSGRTRSWAWPSTAMASAGISPGRPSARMR